MKKKNNQKTDFGKTLENILYGIVSLIIFGVGTALFFMLISAFILVFQN